MFILNWWLQKISNEFLLMQKRRRGGQTSSAIKPIFPIGEFVRAKRNKKQNFGIVVNWLPKLKSPQKKLIQILHFYFSREQIHLVEDGL
jgi:hypothetical protein